VTHDQLNIRPIIGFEIHVQLATRTKLFCGCAVEFGAEANSRVCPVCLGLPGSLPVLNRAAYEAAVKAAVALGCTVSPLTKWDRKSYYYPDLPKNYQISQYDLPVGFDGAFEIPVAGGGTKRIGIIRAHLEEDAGKNMHEGLSHTRVDLNRTGTPLLEIVTQPDIADAEEAYAFCVELQRLVRFLGISAADMQKGQMRFEPNVNVAITTADGREYRTPISEVKNLNSFRAVRLAVQHEIDRQVREWRRDSTYTLQNRGKFNFGWNDATEATEFQRGKEESHDYRYFPDPDLVPVEADAVWLESRRAAVGELPVARQRRFEHDYGINPKDAEIILADAPTADLYEAARGRGADTTTLTKHFLGFWNNLASARGATIGGLGVDSERIAELVGLVSEGAISATAAAQVAEKLCERHEVASAHRENQSGASEAAAAESGVAGLRSLTPALSLEGRASKAAPPAGNAATSQRDRTAREIAESAGLLQVRDESATTAWIDAAFAANPQAVADALGDNERKAKAAPGFLRGQVMKLSNGKADPKLTGELIERKLQEMKPR